MSKVKVAVLGATGMIGQRFIEMLEDHPYFEMEGLYASERSEGKRLGDVLKVRDHVYKDETLDRRIEAMDLDKISKNCRIAFSGIPSDLAGPTETELAEKGIGVFTNAGSHRMDKNVAILIPEVNPQHIESIKDQSTYDNGGFIITNANCSSTGIAAPLAALNDAYGLKQVFISTYQALSGAGYPGVRSVTLYHSSRAKRKRWRRNSLRCSVSTRISSSNSLISRSMRIASGCLSSMVILNR